MLVHLCGAFVLLSVFTACLPASQPQAGATSTAPTASPQPVARTLVPVDVTARAVVPVTRCAPTHSDDLSPTYKPNTPVRSSVGHGHILTGVVRSSRDCAPIANASLELWPEEQGKGHPDEARATVFTDSNGRYRFECNPPEHIHMRISAAGHRTIASNAYHPKGQPEGTFDIVLVPEQP